MESRMGFRLGVLLVGVLLVGVYGLSQLLRIERIGNFERPPEGTAPDGTVDAFEGGMHPRASTRKSSGRIRYHLAVSGNTPQ